MDDECIKYFNNYEEEISEKQIKDILLIQDVQIHTYSVPVGGIFAHKTPPVRTYVRIIADRFIKTNIDWKVYL